MVFLLWRRQRQLTMPFAPLAAAAAGVTACVAAAAVAAAQVVPMVSLSLFYGRRRRGICFYGSLLAQAVKCVGTVSIHRCAPRLMNLRIFE